MAIEILRDGSAFRAIVTRADGDGMLRSTESLPLRELIEVLGQLGFEREDVRAAVGEAGLAWPRTSSAPAVEMSDHQMRTLVTASLMDQPIPDDWWSVGNEQAEGMVLFFRDPTWVGGFVERGKADTRFRERDPHLAAKQFADWVTDTFQSTLASAAATDRWLKKGGRA